MTRHFNNNMIYFLSKNFKLITEKNNNIHLLQKCLMMPIMCAVVSIKIDSKFVEMSKVNRQMLPYKSARGRFLRVTNMLFYDGEIFLCIF